MKRLRTARPVFFWLYMCKTSSFASFPSFALTAGFISRTDDENISARVFAGLLSIPCTDSIPGTPAGWFVGDRGRMRASGPTDYHRRTAKNEGHLDHHILNRCQQNSSRAPMSCGHYDPQPAGFISRTNDENVFARVFAYSFSVLCTDSIPGTPAVSTFIYM